MSIAKVIEVISEGRSIDDAVENAVTEAAKSVQGIKHVYVEGIQPLVEDNKIKQYRVNSKVTFVVSN